MQKTSIIMAAIILLIACKSEIKTDKGYVWKTDNGWTFFPVNTIDSSLITNSLLQENIQTGFEIADNYNTEFKDKILKYLDTIQIIYNDTLVVTKALALFEVKHKQIPIDNTSRFAIFLQHDNFLVNKRPIKTSYFGKRETIISIRPIALKEKTRYKLTESEKRTLFILDSAMQIKYYGRYLVPRK